MSQDRRAHVRFDLPLGTAATNEAGQEIGAVERAGAGGLQLRLTTASPARDLRSGERFRLVVVKPGGERRVLSVEVRYRQGEMMGVRFVKAQSAGSSA